MKKKIAMAICLLSVSLAGCTANPAPVADPIPQVNPVDTSVDNVDNTSDGADEFSFDGMDCDFSSFGTNPNTIGKRTTQYAFDGKYIYMCNLDSIIRRVNTTDWVTDEFLDLTKLNETEAFKDFDPKAVYTIDNAIVQDGYMYAGLSFADQSLPVRINLSSGEIELLKAYGQIGSMLVENNILCALYYYNPVKELTAQKVIADLKITEAQALVKDAEKAVSDAQKDAEKAAKTAEEASKKAEAAKEAAKDDDSKADVAKEAESLAEEAKKASDEANAAYDAAQKALDEINKNIADATAESDKLSEEIAAVTDNDSYVSLWFYDIKSGEQSLAGNELKISKKEAAHIKLTTNGRDVYVICDDAIYNADMLKIEASDSVDWINAVWGTDYVSGVEKMVNSEDGSVVCFRSFFTYDDLSVSKYSVEITDGSAFPGSGDFIVGEFLYKIEEGKLVKYDYSIEGMNSDGAVVDEDFIVPASVYAVIDNETFYLCTTDTVYEIKLNEIIKHGDESVEP